MQQEIIDSLIESVELIDDKGESSFMYELSDATETLMSAEDALQEVA